MLSILIDLVYGLIMAGAGALSVVLLHRCAGHRSSLAANDESNCARKVLASLHELSSRVSVDIGEHSCRVQEFNNEVNSGDNREIDSMMTAVAKIVQANERMQSRLAVAEEKLQEQSRIIELQATEVRTDALTHLINRRGLDGEMARRFSEFKRFGTPFSVMFIDLDDFKAFNSRYGHAAGDEVLRGVAAVLRRVMREIDLAARYGGEEFVVVMPHMLLCDAQGAAERVRKAIEQATVRFDETDLSVTASIGVAQLRTSEHPSILLQRADEALYASKQAGRNNSHWHDGRTAQPVDLDVESSESNQETEIQPAEVPQPEETQPAADAGCDPAALQCESIEQPPKTLESEEAATERPEQDPVLQSTEKNLANSSPLRNDVHGGVSDRSEFCQVVRQRLAEWKRGGSIFSLVLLEFEVPSQIDKQHALGERIRDRVTQSVVHAVRDMDVVARYYRDCLAVMFPGAEHGVTIDIASRLRQAVNECDLPQDGTEVALTVSVGLVEATEGDDLVRLLKRAEEALRCSQKSDNNGSYYHNGQWPEPVDVPAAVSR